jgi:phage shock protein PspC (stress-responsive transcriptional regulator)
MNKTVTVNIGGIVFHIDENAYERFKQYLEAIKMHFTGSEGHEEIMQDIEARIAEMFQEKVKDQKQVITLADVEEVISIMGRPEQFSEGGEQEEGTVEEPTTVNVKRRLFRNPDEKFIGGVCSGIASYFDIDPVWVRLGFIAFLFLGGSGVLLYLILWIIVPEASTTAEKLQMRGEPVTVSNIRKNVQEELEQVKKRLNEISTDKKPGNVFQRLIEVILQIFRFLFLFIGKIFAFFFVLIGLLVMFLLFAGLMAYLNVPGTKYPEIVNMIFESHWQLGIAFFSAFLVVGIPFLMLAYFGARVLFNIRKTSKMVNMSALGLWVLGVVSCILIGVSFAKDFKERDSVRKNITIQQPVNHTLVVKSTGSNSTKEYERWENDEEWNGDWRLSMNEDELQSQDIKLDIVESKTDSFELEQICYSRGPSKKIAEDNASRISYAFTQSDSVITLEPFFTVAKGAKYRGQRMQLLLKVPKGSSIFLDASVRNLIFDIDNYDRILDRDMLNRHWLMAAEGLKCMDCDGTERSVGDWNNARFQHPPHAPRPPHDRVDEKVHIDKNGIYIRSEDGDEVTIDSNGVRVR